MANDMDLILRFLDTYPYQWDLLVNSLYLPSSQVVTILLKPEAHMGLYRSPNYAYMQFMFNVQWSLDFKKNYYIRFYIDAQL